MAIADAILVGDSGKAYFFSGSDYLQYDVSSDGVDPDFPKPISDGWQGIPWDAVDAAVNWGNGKAYLFGGSEYIRYDLAEDRADDGYPRPIQGSWTGVWPDGLDAVANWENGKAYFFKGSQYIRFDVAADRADPGYPKSIAEGFAGAWPSDLDAVVNWRNGKAYFFKGDEYVRWDVKTNRVDGAARPIAGNWGGLGTPLSSPGQSADAEPELSARRRHVLDDVLPGVLPSTYGEKKFTELTFGLTKDNPNVTSGYSTCGELATYVARKLKDQQRWGTFGVRNNAQKTGAWVEADGERRPLPGDIYVLLSQGVTDRAKGNIAHVGFIVDASGDEWKTADAGQGDGWAAGYVNRHYDADAGTLSGENLHSAGARPPRLLAGWLDLDAYPFPD